MKGDLLFVENDHIFGRFIQKFTNGKFNHVAIDMGDGTMYQAMPFGVEHVATSTEHGKITRYASGIEVDAQSLEHGDIFLKTAEGLPYDVIDFVLIGILRVFPRFPRPKTRWAYTCSELAASYLWIINYPLPFDFIDSEAERQIVTPNDLARALGIPVK